MSNQAPLKIFICPNCGGTFERRIKLASNIMKCARCKPRLDKGEVDCIPCKKAKDEKNLER